MDKCEKQETDLSCEVSSPQCFKSSFARSMAVDCMDQRKSLDNVFLDRPFVSGKGALHQTESETLWTPSSMKNNRNCKPITTVCKGNKLLQNGFDLPYFTPLRKNNKTRNQSIDAEKLWKAKQVTVPIKYFCFITEMYTLLLCIVLIITEVTFFIYL
jgi:hypothetical protein